MRSEKVYQIVVQPSRSNLRRLILFFIQSAQSGYSGYFSSTAFAFFCCFCRLVRLSPQPITD
nr:MAG TPA: hypothetical protein [Caudoviricetes sp.]